MVVGIGDGRLVADESGCCSLPDGRFPATGACSMDSFNFVPQGGQPLNLMLNRLQNRLHNCVRSRAPICVGSTLHSHFCPPNLTIVSYKLNNNPILIKLELNATDNYPFIYFFPSYLDRIRKALDRHQMILMAANLFRCHFVRI